MDRPLELKHYVLAAIFILFHAYIPWKAWRGRATVARLAVLPPRARQFASTIVTQAFLLFLSLTVAYAFGFRLLPRVVPRFSDILLGLATAAALVLFMRPRWEAAVRKGDRRLYFFMPQGAKEKAWWVGVSAAAGFGEEVTYRGVLYLLLTLLTGSAWPAANSSALPIAPIQAGAR